MATLMISAVGTLAGGPVGGMIGALAGQAIDSTVFGMDLQGPRLKDLSVTTSAYGVPIPRHFGTMRVAGSVIWATDLVEHSQSSGGKGAPSITSYTYTTSFAIALSSRPLTGIGRIWADGNLLRGKDGALKVGGSMRFYAGDRNQQPDPLIASVESGGCPAFRGLAYVVFEDLQLADFGNRIPALTFEVFADSLPLSVSLVFEDLPGLDSNLDSLEANLPLDGIGGFSCDGAYQDTLAKFQPIFPMSCDANGTSLIITPERLQLEPILVGEATTSADPGEVARKSGYVRKRSAPPLNPPGLLRYYDPELDYQPSLQRALGTPPTGQPATLDLPASLTAQDAFQAINRTARNANWSGTTLIWRTSELDSNIAPGALVTVPTWPGTWRVIEWEWLAAGVTLTLERIAPGNAIAVAPSEAGRAMIAPDEALTPTRLQAFELPWSGVGSPAAIALYAAVSSTGPGWRGASLYVDRGSGALIPIGSSGRGRSTIGSTVNLLPPASPLIFDRQSSLIVQLLSTDMALVNASPSQVISGANRALVGNEIIQFVSSKPLGNGLWQLDGFLRGRGGTEGAISGHTSGESFVLLDDIPIPLDASLVGPEEGVSIAALGLGDNAPAESAIACTGLGRRPLSPVHPRITPLVDGTIELAWTRRARGAWQWLDGVDVALVEETEVYQVIFGSEDQPSQIWQVNEPSLALDATTISNLHATLSDGFFTVSQIGTYSISDKLYIGTI